MPKSRLAMVPDSFDIIAIVFGIFFTVRKLDAQHREHKDFPHVQAGAFREWQQAEVFVYQTGLFACFGKVAADFAFGWFYVRHLVVDPYRDPLARTVGMTLDLSWLAVMLFTFYRTRVMARRRRELGIVLGGLRVEAQTELSTELKAALRKLEDGDIERAAYELRQITLDEDPSMKPIALHWLGQCHRRAGRLEEARSSFLASLEADPTLIPPKTALAELDEAEEAPGSSPH